MDRGATVQATREDDEDHRATPSRPASSRPAGLPIEVAPLRHAQLVPSELAFLRFVAGLRAMLATLAALGFYTQSDFDPWVSVLAGPYLLWAAFLLWKTLHGWRWAPSRWWPWFDAAALLTLSQLMPHPVPLLAAMTVLPVVALALLSGPLHAIALAVACAAAMLGLAGWHHDMGTLPSLPIGMPIVLLAFGPTAALIARPTRELRLRRELLDRFMASSDPRQGLAHHADVLLRLLADRFGLTAAVISLQGPQPRIFQWRIDTPTQALEAAQELAWRERLRALPHDVGCIATVDATAEPRATAHAPATGLRGALDAAAVRALRASGGPALLTLPLMSYGQPLGMLLIEREEPAFDTTDLAWLDGVLRETLPLLERSDLLEQLQRETASRERERIGRDLHDSAVQPYLGLKYGLEALARNAGPANPVAPAIRQLIELATQELQSLRDVVSGLRQGNDPLAESASIAALQRQVERFESLYGLKVQVFAPPSLHLRGSVAKAVLHMVNEALTNVRRHTSATAVTVMFDVQPNEIVVRLRNDHGPGQGLPRDFLPRSLSERAADFGGFVTVGHESNFTEIAITLPFLGAIG